MDRVKFRPFLLMLVLGALVWIVTLFSFWLLLMKPRAAHGFGSTINIEHNLISIYLDEDEFPRITGAEMQKRLCETRLLHPGSDTGAKPPSALMLGSHESTYEVYRRGNPHTFLAKFSINDCYKKEEIHGKEE